MTKSSEVNEFQLPLKSIGQKSPRRILPWLLFGPIFSVALLWLCSPSRRQPEWLGKLFSRLGPQSHRWHVRRVVAANKQHGGQMRAYDYLQILRIRERTGDNITDRDLTKLLRIMHKPSRYPQIVHTHVIASLLDVVSFTDSQREKIFQAVLPLIPGDKFNLDQQYGMKIMKHLGERRAVPLIQSFADHPREKIRIEARETLEALGEPLDYEITKL